MATEPSFANLSYEPLQSEEWRSIPGHPHHLASSFGRVKSVDRTIQRTSQPQFIKGKVLKQTRTGSYLRCGFYHDKYFYVHHLIALAFLGPRVEGMCINHKDGNKENNLVDNLEYVTVSQNIRHAINAGLHKPLTGERHGSAKLTASQVREIRRLHKSGLTTRAIAPQFGIGKSAVHAIVSRSAWSEVS